LKKRRQEPKQREKSFQVKTQRNKATNFLGLGSNRRRGGKFRWTKRRKMNQGKRLKYGRL